MTVKAKLAFPKGPPRNRVKAKRDRGESARIKVVRAACVDRDGSYCRLWYFNDAMRAEIAGLFGACRGKAEWAHAVGHQRWQTRGMAPDDRHSTHGSLMLCAFHHTEMDQHRMFIEALTDRGCDGRLRYERDGKIWEEVE